ncbi:OstA-like protein [uncultured Bacteroides sp.]|uniref:OstA-like protein n=1 Tax=uncultured Bacteroides sp. TaxID=162156 RepID=UPI002AAB342E|nr:OstA-like protein [uncultured Bacteroides sp.]
MLIMNKKKRFSIRHRFLLTGLLCLFGVYVYLSAQVRPGGLRKEPVAAHVGQVSKDSVKTGKKTEKKRTRVDLLHADEALADKLLRPDVQILVGSVKLRHDSMYMYCDSALIYEKTNSVEAFNNVRMEQGDTLFIYGDYLFYDGMAQLAMLRENVKMINRKTTLVTDSLNYDRLYNLGYYFEGGMLTDEENVLTSDWGEYSPSTKVAVFNHEVELVNPRFTLTSDTLKYSTDSKIATILGPSNIVNEKNHIYSERGIYNTLKGQAELLDRSILTNEGKKLVGDSLFYDRKAGYGEAFDNVVMTDTINKNMLTGDYCYYDELKSNALATKKAVAIDYSQGDSLFMHGDTLQMNTYNLNTDSVYREMKAYHKVRMYRTDIQGVCDSLVFSTKDSCLTMYRDPILWNENQQLLGEEIKVYMNDSTIDWAHIINQALTVEKKDSIHYNQISGKEVKAYFQNGEMRKVDVIGNVLVIYYPEEQDSTMIGMNTSETSLLNLYLKDRKMDKMIMSPRSNGTLYPMDQLPADKMKLPTFAWFDYIRPQNKKDIFNWRGKKSGESLRKTSRKPVTSPKRELFKVK